MSGGWTVQCFLMKDLLNPKFQPAAPAISTCYPNCGDSTNLRKKLVWNDWESPPRVEEHASRGVGSPAYNSRGLRGMCWEATRSSPVNVESTGRRPRASLADSLAVSGLLFSSERCARTRKRAWASKPSGSDRNSLTERFERCP